MDQYPGSEPAIEVASGTDPVLAEGVTDPRLIELQCVTKEERIVQETIVDALPPDRHGEAKLLRKARSSDPSISWGQIRPALNNHPRIVLLRKRTIYLAPSPRPDDPSRPITATFPARMTQVMDGLYDPTNPQRVYSWEECRAHAIESGATPLERGVQEQFESILRSHARLTPSGRPNEFWIVPPPQANVLPNITVGEAVDRLVEACNCLETRKGVDLLDNVSGGGRLAPATIEAIEAALAEDDRFQLVGRESLSNRFVYIIAPPDMPDTHEINKLSRAASRVVAHLRSTGDTSKYRVRDIRELAQNGEIGDAGSVLGSKGQDGIIISETERSARLEALGLLVRAQPGIKSSLQGTTVYMHLAETVPSALETLAPEGTGESEDRRLQLLMRCASLVVEALQEDGASTVFPQRFMSLAERVVKQRRLELELTEKDVLAMLTMAIKSGRLARRDPEIELNEDILQVVPPSQQVKSPPPAKSAPSAVVRNSLGIVVTNEGQRASPKRRQA